MATTTSDPRLAAAFREAAHKMVGLAVAQREAYVEHVGAHAFSDKKYHEDVPDDWMHTKGREDLTAAEVQLAKRCHGAHIELLSQETTSVSSHYQLIHYDVPNIDAGSWSLKLHGLVDEPAMFTLEQLKARPSLTEHVMMTCAGQGRMGQRDRFWVHAPWGPDAFGCSQWTGISLADLLKEAGLKKGAKQVVFTGADKGVQGNQVQHFQRALSIDDAMLGHCMLAYEMNGIALPTAHGFPLRLIVPGWYGMASVKWLTSIEITDGSWWGYEMDAYAYKTRPTGSIVPGRYEEGDIQTVPVRHQFVRALMCPPGHPDFFSRVRITAPGKQLITGRAWSGPVELERVEFSSDGGKKWSLAKLEPKNGPFGWAKWSYEWDAPVEEGSFILSCRAFDKAGRCQDDADADGLFNFGAFTITKPQEVLVKVNAKIECLGETIDTVPEIRAAKRALWEADGRKLTEEERDALYQSPGSQ